MVPKHYDVRTLPHEPSALEVARFLNGVERVRSVADIPSLRVHNLSARNVNEGVDDHEIMDLAAGRRVTVELRGGYKPPERASSKRIGAWATFDFWKRGDGVVITTFQKLCVGDVEAVEAEDIPAPDPDDAQPRTGGWGTVFDITRDTLNDGRGFALRLPTYIPGFPREWQQLVQAHVAAESFAWLLSRTHP